MMTGSSVFLRAPEPSDASLLYTWENNPETWVAGDQPQALSLYQLESYLKDRSLNDLTVSGQQRWMICATRSRRPIGTIDLFEYRHIHARAGVGILIGDHKDRGKGKASEALSVFLPYAFEVVNLRQVWCLIAPDNQASINLFESVGFVQQGVFRNWIYRGPDAEDRLFYQLLRS
ncbi:MAG: GNAT family N-acetyltransferase [Flavobacteriales bacterium]|nr:GNAT family N-acetyltransferase [Flavobacteriales bacterium]MCB9447859.1 GNAT family N-acetyltransferase [Flavobacteriales bacterium]